ncbi:MAG: alpha/beta hydrolase-fold protein [Gemmatimonadota bacterium]|nr:alpha/beta hydrolase-fold protein [Gemmatimonadota bacterium]
MVSTPTPRRWTPYPAESDPGELTVVGTVMVLADFAGPQLQNRRDIFVYLPPSYNQGERRYPVLYMQDGQNLFDRATSFGEEWGVDQTLEEGAGVGLEAIVVGIANLGEERVAEYSPWVDDGHGGGRGDDYLEWITRTLKPAVDVDFRTLPTRESTGIAGSSMGGLISLYAFLRHPEVFGFAGVMSPALWFAGGKALEYAEAAPRSPGKIYLDVGTREGEEAVANVRRLREILSAKGYESGRDLLYVVEMGGAHEERAWARRLRKELHFLLGVPMPVGRVPASP